MPDPSLINIASGDATYADLADPSRRGVQSTRRLRALRGDFTDSQPLALIPCELDLSTNPTAADTVTIGGTVYEFLSTGSVAADANVAVLIGVDAAATLANFIAAINGTAAAQHASLTKTDAVTPAIGIGSAPVTATASSTTLLLWYTGNQGVSPLNLTHDQYANFPTAYPSFALSDGLTAAVAWTIANFNLLPAVHPTARVQGMIGLRIDVVTALLDVPFQIWFAGASATSNVAVGVVASPKSSSGVPLYWDAARFDVSGGIVEVTLATTGAVDPANGDVLDLIVFGDFAGMQA
jgi:hypothetical protein